MVKLGSTFHLVDVNALIWIESDGNYIRLHMPERSYLLRETLTHIEKKLDGDQFVRINRSIIVNIDRIKELRSHKKSDYMVVLDNDKSWIWGRRFRENLRRVMN